MTSFNDCNLLGEVHYNGTVKEFEKVKLNWYYDDGEGTIYGYNGVVKEIKCTDGEVLITMPK
jgi:hypothetical protein